jgi:hypothetical protein
MLAYLTISSLCVIGICRCADPWEHVLFIGVGAALGNFMQNKYHRDLEEVEELRLYLERRANVNKKA